MPIIQGVENMIQPMLFKIEEDDYLDSIEVLTELRSLLLIFHLQLAQLLVDVWILLFIETQDTLKGLTQFLAFVFQHLLIKLRLLYWVKLLSSNKRKGKIKWKHLQGKCREVGILLPFPNVACTQARNKIVNV